MRKAEKILLCIGISLFLISLSAPALPVYGTQSGTAIYTPADGMYLYSDPASENGKEYIAYVLDGIIRNAQGITAQELDEKLSYIDQKTTDGGSLSFSIPGSVAEDRVQTLIIAKEGENAALTAFLVKDGTAFSGFFTDENGGVRTASEAVLDKGADWESIAAKLPAQGTAVFNCGVSIPVTFSFTKPETFEKLTDAGLSLTASVNTEDTALAGFLTKYNASSFTFTVKTPGSTPSPAPDPQDPSNETEHFINVMRGAKATKGGKTVISARPGDEIGLEWVKKEGFIFSKWVLSGALPKDSLAEKTTFTMGTRDVTVKYEEKLKETVYEDEELPEEVSKDSDIKVKSLKFKTNKLLLYTGDGPTDDPATPQMASGEPPAVYYTTSNAGIAAVTGDGKFYPVGSGEAVVTAHCGNRTASCSVRVVSVTESIAVTDKAGTDVTGDNVSMKGGEKELFNVSFNPFDSSDPRDVTWKSNNKNITVNKGWVTVKDITKQETATITATVKATDTTTGRVNKLQKAEFTVTASPVELSPVSSADKSHRLAVNKKSLKLVTTEGKNEGKLPVTLTLKSAELSLEDISVTCKSSNEDVITVNGCDTFTATGKNGKTGKGEAVITALRAGTAYVTVISSGGDDPEKVNVQRCKVTVTSPATALTVESGSLSLTKSGEQSSTLTMRKGTNGTVRAVLTPEHATDAGNVKMSGTGGVTVKNGIIYAKKPTREGRPAKVTVRCGKLKYIIDVTVTK